MNQPYLVLDDVSRVHGSGALAVSALVGASLSLQRGELVAVMGPSGSGKSTLLNLAGALDRPTSGRVLIDGVDLSTLSAKQVAAVRRTKVGFVFQDFNLVPSLTAAENVFLPLELGGLSVRECRPLADQALAYVDLDGLGDRFPSELSGGQRQRVAIARALIGDRSLVLADEPTGALDTHTGDLVLRLLLDRCDAGAAGLLVTHDARLAAWADRVVFLRDGRMVDTAVASDSDMPLFQVTP